MAEARYCIANLEGSGVGMYSPYPILGFNTKHYIYNVYLKKEFKKLYTFFCDFHGLPDSMWVTMSNMWPFFYLGRNQIEKFKLCQQLTKFENKNKPPVEYLLEPRKKIKSCDNYFNLKLISFFYWVPRHPVSELILVSTLNKVRTLCIDYSWLLFLQCRIVLN